MIAYSMHRPSRERTHMSASSSLTSVLAPALTLALCLHACSLTACTPSAAPPAAQLAAPPTAPPDTAALTAGDDPGAGPDDDAIELPPDQYHGNWRVVAADDRNDAALMAISIQSSKGEAQGSGDFVLFQPFCDAVAGQPITGITDCELIDMGAAFDQVQATPERILLVFHPTADGAEHRLELHRDGERLLGNYVANGNDIRLPVIAARSRED
jgi:hypothetical protein